MLFGFCSVFCMVDSALFGVRLYVVYRARLCWLAWALNVVECGVLECCFLASRINGAGCFICEFGRDGFD